jgi:large subunit ribosomal protein L15
MLESRFEAGAVVDSNSLFEKNLIRSIDSSYKILGSGSLDKSLNVDAPRISQGAKEAIEAAGGSYNETSPAEKRVRNRKHLRKT